MLESEIQSYERFFNKGCGSGTNKTTITLLVYSIIIIIFAIVGFIFRISKNEGHKKYKEEIEKVLGLLDTNLPDDLEMEKILNFSKLFNAFKQNYINSDSKNYLSSLDYNYYYSNNCTYQNFRTGICNSNSYQKYCDEKKYSDNECNLVDYLFHTKGKFRCNSEDYSRKKCSYQQYIDHTNRYLDDFLYYGGKPKRIDLTASYGSKRGDNANIEYSFKNIYGISFYKFWCDIGKYDTPIFIGIIILTTIFIILFIIDLFIKKDNISNGIIYYIIVILYMILYIVLRIFICLIFCFLVYSIIVTSSTPNFEIEHNSSLITYTNSYLDYNYKYSYNNINYEFAPPETIWNLKRTYAIISTASVFFIFSSKFKPRYFIIINLN